MFGIDARELLDIIDELGTYTERCLAPVDEDDDEDNTSRGLGIDELYQNARVLVYRAGRFLRTLPITRHLVSAIVSCEIDFEDKARPEYVRHQDICQFLTVLKRAVLIEFQGVMFLHVDEDRAQYYEQREPPFGSEVADRFAAANADVCAAARCYALDEWTATVFHLMRAAECALRDVAAELGVQDIDRKTFGQLVQEARTKNDALPSSDPKKQFLAEALVSLDLFRDAWRNPVAHGRDNYDERRTTNAWNGVRAFMQSLAKGWP